jgi:CheY-like chemotaxis protein
MNTKQKILLIDDDSVTVKTFSDYLVEKGYDVHSAENGDVGFKEAKTWMPDVILLDMIMPVMNGVETLKKIREANETKNIPVLILTNIDGPEEVAEAMQLGQVQYLVKANYSMEDIYRKIVDITTK